MADDSGVTEVRYTVKELLADIKGAIGSLDTKMAALDVKLDTKADKVDVMALTGRLDRLEKVEAVRATAAKDRAQEMEEKAVLSERARDTRRWYVGLIAALGGSGIGYIIERIVTGH